MVWGCDPMAPWAGRLRRGRLHFAGRTYRLPIDAEPHAIHGTVYRRVWVVDEEGSMATGLGADWPFAGHARQRITLEPGAPLVLSMDRAGRHEGRGLGIIAAGVSLVAAASIAAVVLSSRPRHQPRQRRRRHQPRRPDRAAARPVRVRSRRRCAIDDGRHRHDRRHARGRRRPRRPAHRPDDAGPAAALLAAAGTLLDLGSRAREAASSSATAEAAAGMGDLQRQRPRAATAGGTLGPSQQTEVTIASAATGYRGRLRGHGVGARAPARPSRGVRWRDRAPVVHVTLDPPGLADAATCRATAKDLTGTVSASVIDESSWPRSS